MLSVSNSNIFSDYHSIEMTPVVSAEWNHNYFTSPYVTVAGNGIKKIWDTPIGSISTADKQKENFTTKQFSVTSGSGFVTYPISTDLGGYAYKVVTYIKTNTIYPVMINTNIFTTTDIHQHGTSSTEVNSIQWTKIETYVGSDTEITDIEYTINASIVVLNGETAPNFNVYFTEPELYETTKFDYKYNSMWPTDSPFTFLRPGESYVKTGNENIEFPLNYRRVATQIGNTEPLAGDYYGTKYMPISPICYNPGFAIMENPQSVIMKNGLPTNLMPYQYFISDIDSKILTGIYEKDIYVNKIVIKFNNIITSPTEVTVTIDDVPLSPATPFVPNDNGLLTLYWNGTDWGIEEWSSMPSFNNFGILSKYTLINKITIETLEQKNTVFEPDAPNDEKYDGIDIESDRMQIIEISPRLEIDISNFVKTVNINKSIDSGNSQLPISSLNSNDASIILTGIPVLTSENDVLSIFSNSSNNSGTILSGIMGKNVKLYINFFAKSAFEIKDGAIQRPNNNVYIPGGIYYADSWIEEGTESVEIQAFDVSRYLQFVPVPDYVASIKPVFDIITNILDLVGFTDYDYDSLYSVCNNPSTPLDIAYYYCNGKETTIIEALSEIFLAYQIGAYIDEYGIMKFLSLSQIFDPNLCDPLQNLNIIDIDDSIIIDDGYSVKTNPKAGKLSLTYNPPKIKQSASLHNITNPDIKNSPSFILTTSNDVNWSQQQLDSVGFNYLNANMAIDDTKFKIDINDLLDIFRTYSLNASGYSVIEDEIVSFKYKQYNIVKPSTGESVTVSVKNDIELAAQINKFTKKYSVGLQKNVSIKSTASLGISGGSKVITLSNTDGFAKYGRVQVRKITGSTYSSGGAPGETSVVLSAENSDISVGQKIKGTGFGDNTFVTGISGTLINFFPAAKEQIAGSISFLYEDSYMYGYITSVIEDTSIAISVDNFNGSGNHNSWWIENVPSYDIYVEPTGYITNIERGVFNTKLSDHKILSTNILNDKDLSQATANMSYVATAGGANVTIVNNQMHIAIQEDKRTLIYPNTERDNGYHTYSTKFTILNDPVNAAMGGIFFNLDPTLADLQDTYFVDVVKHKFNNELGDWKYWAVIHKVGSSGYDEIIAYADVSRTIRYIADSLPGILKRKITLSKDKFFIDIDDYIHLKVVHQQEKTEDGNVAIDDNSTISVFLNNIEISSWQVAGLYSDIYHYTSESSLSLGTGNKTVVVSGKTEYDLESNPLTSIYLSSSENVNDYMYGAINDVSYDSVADETTLTVNVTRYNNTGTFSSWKIHNQFEPQSLNRVTGVRKRINLPVQVTEGTIFGISFTTIMNLFAEFLLTVPTSPAESIFRAREIYATQTPLIDRSINYYYQNRNFLNSVILNQRNLEKTYCMQTKPEVVGINYYDIQYDNPAAVSTDVLPIEYLWHYFPSDRIDDQRYRQTLYVETTALAYSTVINTGFRGKFMIANNSPFVVYLNKESDAINQFAVALNVWTHEIIAPSSQEIIEKVIDKNNLSETIQIDSEWIQSDSAAYGLMSVIGEGINKFSREVSLNIFGNPLIQVGDIVSLSHNIKGINQQKHLVKSISHSFDSGLSTSLGLSALNDGTDYE